MAKMIEVSDPDGKKTYLINADAITSIEHIEGEPGEPAVEAKPEVKDDPGEPATAANPHGRAPTKGHPAIAAKPAKPGKPDTAEIKLSGGDSLKVGQSVRALRAAIASAV